MQWSKIKTLTLIMCILPVTFLSGCTEKKTQALPPTVPLILVDNGTCNVSIHNIAAGAPSTVETFAAEELQKAFKLACGVAPPINPASPAAIEIRLGVADRFSEGVGDASDQAYTIRRTIDGHIELVGNCKGAVMWAVDDFCKEVLHVSWPISTDVMMLEGSQQSTITVGQLFKVQAPDFGVRGWLVGANIDGYHYSDTIGKWMAHNRMNTVHNRIDRISLETFSGMPDTTGGTYEKILARGLTVDTTMHDLAWLIPREMYDEHPEYFPLINGERIRPGPDNISVQRCISNPDVRDIIITKIEQGFIDYPDIKVFGVGQNDAGAEPGWCECASCMATDGAQAGTGQYSNRLILFINYLADTIAPNHPGKYIGTMAYGETVQPPDINIADNVSITFCYSGGGNYMKKLTDPTDSANAAVMTNLNGWLDKSENVHLWTHYWTTSMDSCFTPYARTLIEGFSDLKELGFKGFVGETRPPYWPSQRLFFYALARAAWDNSLDFDEILDDYCSEAYGPAASAMKSYYLLYEGRIYENVPFLTRDGACAQLFPPAFSPADMTTLEGYISSAETAVAGGFQANIDAVAEMREMFDKFKAISIDPCDIPGIGPNLILNPGAESGSANWVSDVLFGSGDYSFTIATDVAHSGNKSFKIECTGAVGWARWYQSVGDVLTPGKKYAARFWIRADNNNNPGIVEFYMPERTGIGWQDSDDEWVRIVVPELTATGTGFSIWPSMDEEGYVYFDDFFIAELP